MVTLTKPKDSWGLSDQGISISGSDLFTLHPMQLNEETHDNNIAVIVVISEMFAIFRIIQRELPIL